MAEVVRGVTILIEPKRKSNKIERHNLPRAQGRRVDPRVKRLLARGPAPVSAERAGAANYAVAGDQVRDRVLGHGVRDGT